MWNRILKIRKTKRSNRKASSKTRRTTSKTKRRFHFTTIKIKWRISNTNKQRSSYKNNKWISRRIQIAEELTIGIIGVIRVGM